MTITAASLQTQEYRFQHQTSAGRWLWVTVVDVSRTVPTYRIERIITPYGLFRDSIPIPGDVAVAFAESITTLQTQFSPVIFVGPPSSLTFTVDEGRGYSEPEEVLLTNNGPFGSLLGVSLTTSAAYIDVEPSVLGNLASQESGTFGVSVNSQGLLASGSPYAGTVTLVDSEATNSPQTFAITINVRAKATIAASPALLTFNVVKPISGDFAPLPTQTFVVENTGPSGSVLEWQIQQTGDEPWFQGVFPVSGSLGSGDTETITVSVAPPVSTLTGTYTAILRISGYSTNQFLDFPVQLVVT